MCQSEGPAGGSQWRRHHLGARDLDDRAGATTAVANQGWPGHSVMERRRPRRLGTEESDIPALTVYLPRAMAAPHARNDRLPRRLLSRPRVEPRGKTGRWLPQFSRDSGVRAALSPGASISPSDRARRRPARNQDAAVPCRGVAPRPRAHRHHGVLRRRTSGHEREHAVRCWQSGFRGHRRPQREQA